MKSVSFSDTLRMLRATTIAAALGLIGLTPLQAVTIYDSNGFEPVRFSPTMALEGQDAPPLGQGPWMKSNSSTPNANSATLVNNSNNTEGDVVSVRVTRAANQAGDNRWFVSKPVDMTPVPNENVVNVEVDVRVNQSVLPSGGPTPAYGIEAYDGAALIGSMTVDPIDGFLRYVKAGTGEYVRVSGSALSLGGPGAGDFHRFKLSLNFTTRTYSLYVNDVLRHTEPFVNSTVQNFTDAPIAAVCIGGTPAASTTAFFDNYRITQVPAVTPPVKGPLTVHPLGDSITWGYTTASAADSPGGYREPLYRNLKLAGLMVDFLGANTSNPGPLLSQYGEVHHDGYPKYTITDIYDNLASSRQPVGNNQPFNNGGYWLTGRTGRTAIYPEKVLLLIGTNDIEGGTSQASVIESRLDRLIARILALRPDTHLYVANIPPYPVDANKTAIAKAYGELIRTQTVPKYLAQGWKITFVDQYSNFVSSTSATGDVVNSALFGDTVHPNEAGYQKMGDTWAAAILNTPTTAPAAPAGLTATAVSDRQIDLRWTDNSNNEGAFMIERSSDNVTFTQIGQTAADQTGYSDFGLPGSTQYFYRVRAKNIVGNSAYSNIADATTQPPSPSSPPSGLTAVAGSAQVTLTWNAPTGATSYNVKRSMTDGGPYATIATTTATTYTDTTVENDTTYYYVVSANNEVGESADSNQVSATPSGAPTAWFEFEFTTLDSSGNNNHGAPVGTVLYGQGNVGTKKSAQFNGTAFAEIRPVVSTDFSVALWVKTTSTVTGGQWYQGMGLVDGEMVGSAADWGCSVLNSKFALGIGGPDKTISTNASINDGKWHHVVATRNSSTGRVHLYVDGVLDKTDVAATGARTAPNELRIGATHANPPVAFVGNLDDLRLYNRVLTANEIAKIVASRNTAPSISPLANRTVRPGGSTGAISFTVSDSESTADTLIVTGASSDPNLVPAENITFGGSGTDRTVTVTAAPGQIGTATITLSVSDGETTTQTAFDLRIVEPPTITSQPQSQTVLVGKPVTFSVTASGTEPFSYRWRFNGVDIQGANAASYTISSAELSHAGEYSVVVINAGGTVTSAAATLTVNMDAVYTGRAAVLSATILGVTNSWSDTGPRPESGGAQETSAFSINESGLSAEVAHAFSLGQGDRTYSESSVANVVLNVGGVLVRADFVMSRALAAWDTDHTALSGVSQITNLIVAGQPVVVTGEPNQVVPLGNSRVVINEQITTGNEITVNGLHVAITGYADVVVASAQAGFDSRTEPVLTEGDYVTGGGWITGTPSGGKGIFGVDAGIDENRQLSGSLSYKDQTTGMKVKATSITAYQQGTTEDSRRIEGTAEVNGVPGYSFVLEVADNGEPGRNDTFSLKLSNGYEASGTLGGGNIQLN